jgi:NADH:ubiquinone oxidoreductase subunit F (NADH-binding)
MLDVLERLCNAKSKPDDLKLLERIGNSMKIGSLCGHGQLGFNPISSALKYFEQEIMTAVYNNSEPLEKMYTPTRTRPGELD